MAGTWRCVLLSFRQELRVTHAPHTRTADQRLHRTKAYSHTSKSHGHQKQTRIKEYSQAAASQTLHWGRTSPTLMNLFWVLFTHFCLHPNSASTNTAHAFHRSHQTLPVFTPTVTAFQSWLPSYSFQTKGSFLFKWKRSRIFPIAFFFWQKLWTGQTSQSRTINIHKAPEQCSKPKRDTLFPNTNFHNSSSLFLSNHSFWPWPQCTSLPPAPQQHSSLISKQTCLNLPA